MHQCDSQCSQIKFFIIIQSIEFHYRRNCFQLCIKIFNTVTTFLEMVTFHLENHIFLMVYCKGIKSRLTSTDKHPVISSHFRS